MVTSSMSASGHRGSGASNGLGFLLLALGASATGFISGIGFLLVLILLIFLVANSRIAAVLFGLILAIGCGVAGFTFITDTDPKHGDANMFGVVFLPWAGFGLYMVV